MDSGRTFTAGLVGFALGFVASNLLVVASMENARLRAQLDLLKQQVVTLRSADTAREARLEEIIAAWDEQFSSES